MKPRRSRASDRLVDGIRETMAAQRGKKLLVAVSGGLDSVSLLDLLLQVRDELRLELVVAHADHGVRDDSAADAAFVRELAAAYSLPFVTSTLKLAPGGNLEGRAREARYAWLESVRKRRRADYIVTAHQADDQVETLFLHLARGAGLGGLAGMKTQTYRLLRPLLAVPRKEITRYARKRKLHYRLDSTNRNLQIARNRVRRRVVTNLQKLNPQLIETVTQSMRVLADEYGVLQEMAARELAAATVSSSTKRLALSRVKVAGLSRGLRHHLWREALRRLCGDLAAFRLKHLENLDDLLNRQTGSRIHLPRSVTAYRRYDEIVLARSAVAVRNPRTVKLPVPGATAFGDSKLAARGLRTTAPDLGNQGIVVDRQAVGSSLLVRSPKPGDRFKPAGMRGSKLVSDLLTDAKVPRDERPWVPIVTTGTGEIVWVAGLRADRRFAATPGKRRLSLRLTDPSRA